LRDLWREQIITFNQDSQERLLGKLHIPEPDGGKLVMLLAGAFTLVVLWLTWQLRRELDPAARDRLVRTYARLCAKLAGAGLPRLPHEGAENYAARIAVLRPDLGQQVIALCGQYSRLRYARASTRLTLGQFQAAVRGFRVRQPDSRASSGK
jgi:hypothetical protein